MRWNQLMRILSKVSSRASLAVVLSVLCAAGQIDAQEAINVNSKSSVLRAYKNLLKTTRPKPQWQGSFRTGQPGPVSATFQTATLNAINFYRAMAGINPVVFREDWSQKAAAAALIMTAANDLDHQPPSNWRFWSADGFEAAGHSNLHLGYTGARSIAGYIEDPGDNNTDVGHRTWILYPESTEMGSGNAYDFRNGNAANALWVHPERDDPDPETDEYGLPPEIPTRDGFVAWPPPGLVPNTLVHRRWSFSKSESDFSRAVVRMRDGKKTVRARVVARPSGFGDPTLVFEPRWKLRTNPYSEKIDEAEYVATSGRKKKRVRVSITGVGDHRTGVVQSFTYRVHIFPVRVPKSRFGGEITP